MKRISLFAVLAALAACTAPSRVTETYRADDLQTNRFNKLLVVGVAGSANSRRLFEDALAAELGSRAVTSYRAIGRLDDINRDMVLAAAKNTGADGVLVTRIKDAQTRSKVKGARTEMKLELKEEVMKDFFTYEYVDITDPAYVTLLTTVVLASDVYRVSDEQRVYAIESTAFDKQTVTDIVTSLSRAMASQLRRSGVVR